MRKKGILIVVLFLMLITGCFTGCGRKAGSGASHPEGIDGYGYLSEYLVMKDGDQLFRENFRVQGEALYYFENMGGNTCRIRRVLLTDRDSWESVSEGRRLPEGEVLVEWKLGEEGVLMPEFELDAAGNLYYILDMSLLCRNPAGEVVYSVDCAEIVGEEEKEAFTGWYWDSAHNCFTVDSSGRVWLCLEKGGVQQLVTLSAQGEVIEQVLLDEAVKSVTASGGRLFGCMEEEKNGMIFSELVEILPEQGSLLSLSGLPKDISGEPVGLEDGDLLVFDSDYLYRYDPDTQESSPVLRWQECNVYFPYFVEGDDIERLYIFESGGLSVLDRLPAEELPERKQLVLAALQADPGLKQAIVQFNRRSGEYHVELQECGGYGEGEDWQEAVAKLDRMLLSKGSPDMIDLSNLEPAKYASNDALADLTPYLQQSELLNREDYLEGILQRCTINGRLITIPRQFYLQTFAGRTSQVGDSMGWTMEDVRRILEENPGMKLLEYTNQWSFMRFAQDYISETFVDWENGKCCFDSPEFVDFLEWMKSLMGEGEFTVGPMAGNVLLDSCAIQSPMVCQEEYFRFGEEFTFIGMPTEKGTPDHMISLYQSVAILDQSENKDGAWAFMEFFLSGEEISFMNLDTRREQLEKCLLASTEKSKDVNDKEMPKYTVYYGDGTQVEYYAATREETERVWEIIDPLEYAHRGLGDISDIIVEEWEALLADQKTAGEVAAVIQSRAELYLSEQYE